MVSAGLSLRRTNHATLVETLTALMVTPKQTDEVVVEVVVEAIIFFVL